MIIPTSHLPANEMGNLFICKGGYKSVEKQFKDASKDDE